MPGISYLDTIDCLVHRDIRAVADGFGHGRDPTVRVAIKSVRDQGDAGQEQSGFDSFDDKTASTSPLAPSEATPVDVHLMRPASSKPKHGSAFCHP